MSTIFVTERLTVRPWELADTDAFFAIFGDAEVYRFLPGDPIPSRDAAALAIERLLARMTAWEGMGSFAAVDRASGEIVGNVLLRPLEDGPRIEVGYHIAQSHWGKGFASELAQGAVHYGFDNLGLDEIFGVVVPENGASRRVLEKAGLISVGPGSMYGLECVVMLVRREESVGQATSS